MGGRASWDQTAVLVAVRGWETYCNAVRGTYRMVGKDELLVAGCLVDKEASRHHGTKLLHHMNGLVVELKACTEHGYQLSLPLACVLSKGARPLLLFF